MSSVLIPIPTWAAGVGGLPVSGMARVLGRLDGAPHVISARRDRRDRARVVAKRYADKRGPHVAHVMSALGTTLGAGAPLGVPAVLAWDSRRSVLVQAEAPGQPLLPILQSGDATRALAAAAKALACLHDQPVSSGPQVGMSDHLRDLVRPDPEVVAQELEDVGDRVRTLVAAVVARARAAPPVRAVPVHRDAHARQMLLDGSRIWMVDWDLFARGDPALDVANFTVYLRTRLTAGAQEAAARFLNAYAEAGADLSGRIPLYSAFTYIRLLCKAYRLKPPGWRRRVAEYLALAEAHAAH